VPTLGHVPKTKPTLQGLNESQGKRMNDETFALRVFFHHSAFSLFLFSPCRTGEEGGVHPPVPLAWLASPAVTHIKPLRGKNQLVI